MTGRAPARQDAKAQMAACGRHDLARTSLQSLTRLPPAGAHWFFWSPDHLLQVLFFLQSIDFNSREVGSRHHAHDASIFDDGKMPKPTVVHGPQRLDCGAVDRYRRWRFGHRLPDWRCARII